MSYDSQVYDESTYEGLTHRIIEVESTSYSLTFTDISLRYFKVTVEPVSYSLTFTDIVPIKKSKIDVEPSSYSLTFTDIIFHKGYILSTEPASYSLTFTDINFIRNYVSSVDPATYSLAFTDIELVNRRLTIEPNSYSLTFTDINLLRQLKTIVEPNSYSLTFTDITFLRYYLIPAEPTSYSLTYTNIDVLRQLKINVESTSYSLTFTDISLLKDFVLPIESTSYSLTFTNIIPLKDWILPIDSTSYSLTFTDIILTYYSGVVPHNIYVLSKTPQGEYLKHKIESGKLNIEWPMATASLNISNFVPPDSLCTVYINQTTKVFEGVAIDCPKDGRFQQYGLELLGHISPFIPDPPKAGLYLGRYTWENIQLQYLLGSNKPTDNNNELGIIYMANSILFDHLFELYDSDHYIYSWSYYGTTYTISEVFEDTTLMTAQTSIAALESSAGWYHDTSTNTFYVRTSDNLSPYYHCITVPNIWDGLVPIRLGYVKDKAATNIVYEECKYGDKPLELIEEILYALGLEYEISTRGDIAYINVAETVGRGSYNSPSMTFAAGTNIEQIKKINIANGRYLTNTVAINGYGSGPSQIRSAAHRNMGRGGKFVFINNAGMYSETTAKNYATEYLNEMYLPQKEIVFSSNVYSKDIPTQKYVGDFVNIQIPSEKINQLLRIQKIYLDLKTLSSEFTLSNNLITLDQRRKALENAIEKYINHLEDTQESYQWNWETNLDYNLPMKTTFTIDDDVVSLQKLDLDISYKNWESTAGKETCAGGDHAHGGDTGAGGEHSDHTTGLLEEADESEDTSYDICTVSHTHEYQTGTPTSDEFGGTVYVAAYNHTHNYTTPANTSTVTVSASNHTHSINALSLAASGSNQSSVPLTFGVNTCTAPNCTKSFYACVDTTFSAAKSDHTHSLSSGSVSASASTETVAAGDHQHPEGTTGVESDYESVADYEHYHEGTTETSGIDEGMFITVVEDSHTHSIAGKSTTANAPIDLPIGDSGDDTRELYAENALFSCGSQPEMYLTVKVDGTQITGSPFVIGVAGEYTYNDDEKVYEISGSISKTSISDIVTSSGNHIVQLSLSNKTSPGSLCRCRCTVNLNGRYYIESITS